MVKISIQGCIHGDINRCYEAIPLDSRALLWTGDVQTIRCSEDLDSLACPEKYKAMKDFHEYYGEAKRAPVLTAFIGGNHESSAFLANLPYGGWVAPDLYYFGYCGVINLVEQDSKPVRISGLSGIYNQNHWHWEHLETLPLTRNSIRSIYHARERDLMKLQNAGEVDAVITHDWPADLFDFATEADRNRLLRRKPYFAEDIQNRTLGNPFSSTLLKSQKPRLWFAAHLHVDFVCDLKWDAGASTKFITHDKPKKFVSTSCWDTESDSVVRESASSTSAATDRAGSAPKRARTRSDMRLDIDLEWVMVQSRYELRRNLSDTDMSRVTKAEMIALSTRLASAGISANGLDELIEASDEINISDLRRIRFPYPHFDHKDPDTQTRWWRSILGVEGKPTSVGQLRLRREAARRDEGPASRSISPPARYFHQA